MLRPLLLACFKLFRIVWDSHRLESCCGHPPFQRPKLLQTYIYSTLLSKVFESQVIKQITDHFESHRTFSTTQSGFRAGHGCTSTTLKVLNDIITAIDKRHYCAAVFIDLAKAFDSVNHNTLLLADSTALVSQMIASPGSPTTSLIDLTHWTRRACCPDLWQSLWGCHRVHISGRLSSLYTSMMSLLLLVIFFFDPPLHRRHHSVYFWPFFGHCVN